jgi:hypothetical protein
MVYVGLHFVLFSFLKSVAITDPKAMMLVVRMIHAGLERGGGARGLPDRTFIG